MRRKVEPEFRFRAVAGPGSVRGRNNLASRFSAAEAVSAASKFAAPAVLLSAGGCARTCSGQR